VCGHVVIQCRLCFPEVSLLYHTGVRASSGQGGQSATIHSRLFFLPPLLVPSPLIASLFYYSVNRADIYLLFVFQLKHWLAI